MYPCFQLATIGPFLGPSQRRAYAGLGCGDRLYPGRQGTSALDIRLARFAVIYRSTLGGPLAAFTAIRRLPILVVLFFGIAG